MTFFWGLNFPKKSIFLKFFRRLGPGPARAPEAKTLGRAHGPWPMGPGPWAHAHGPILGPNIFLNLILFIYFPGFCPVRGKGGYTCILYTPLRDIPPFSPNSIFSLSQEVGWREGGDGRRAGVEAGEWAGGGVWLGKQPSGAWGAPPKAK